MVIVQINHQARQTDTPNTQCYPPEPLAQVRPNDPSSPALLQRTLKFSSYYYYLQESTVLFGHSLDFHLWKRYLISLVCNSVPNNQTALPSNTDKWFRTQTSVWVVLLIVCSSRRKKKNKEEEVEQEEVEQGWRRRKRKECHYNNEMRNQSFCLYSGNEAKSCMCGCL